MAACAGSGRASRLSDGRAPATVNGPWPMWERCGATWPRGSWVRLLEEATAGEKMTG